jgi:hypothetical protein
MAGQPSDYGREVRDVVVKSGLTGVAASILAVAAFSPAGFGGMIGASLASGFGLDSNASAADNPYANLPAYPAPLTQAELSQIRGQLVSTAAQLEITRAATDAKIEHVRSLALSDGMVTFTPAPRAQAELRLSLSEPSSFAAAAAGEAPVEAYVIEPAAVEATASPISYSGSGDYEASAPYRDPHLELADLLLAHENL